MRSYRPDDVRVTFLGKTIPGMVDVGRIVVDRRERPLSPQQIAMLASIRRYGNPWHHVHGQAAHGGADGTVRSLYRRGLTSYPPNGSERWMLTPAGSAALRDARAARRRARSRR